MLKGIGAALAGAAAMALAGQAQATIIEEDFTISGWTLGGLSTGAPLGADMSSPSSGSFWYDDTGSGVSAITAINWTVGSYTFTLADLSLNSSITWLVFDPTTGVSSFSLGFRDPVGFDPEPGDLSLNGVEEFGAEVSLGPNSYLGGPFDSARIYSANRVVTDTYSGDDLSTYKEIQSSSVTVSPELRNPPVVPEPSTWALMLMGFGGLGAALRRRRDGLVTSAR